MRNSGRTILTNSGSSDPTQSPEKNKTSARYGLHARVGAAGGGGAYTRCVGPLETAHPSRRKERRTSNRDSDDKPQRRIGTDKDKQQHTTDTHARSPFPSSRRRVLSTVTPPESNPATTVNESPAPPSPPPTPACRAKHLGVAENPSVATGSDGVSSPAATSKMLANRAAAAAEAR